MSAHTPGPWTAGEQLTGGSIPVYQTKAGYGMQVARVNGKAGEQEANARLIAAAPAYAVVWAMVPDEIKQRIFDSLYKPETAWIESAILRAEGK